MDINWINCADEMPAQDDTEILVFSIKYGWTELTPANEMFYEVDSERLHEWKWAEYTKEKWEFLNG